jgi:hypothetical protein
MSLWLEKAMRFKKIKIVKEKNNGPKLKKIKKINKISFKV